MNIATGDVPLVLLCPAWMHWGTATVIKPNSVILHSREDDVIPFADSEKLIFQSRLSTDILIAVGNDHRLADAESLSVMLWACNLLGSGLKISWSEDDSLTRDTSHTSRSTSQEESSYICDACGEEIVIPLDLTEGSQQTYVEDCPVCCRANKIHVHIDTAGEIQAWAEPEQDHY